MLFPTIRDKDGHFTYAVIAYTSDYKEIVVLFLTTFIFQLPKTILYAKTTILLVRRTSVMLHLKRS